MSVYYDKVAVILQVAHIVCAELLVAERWELECSVCFTSPVRRLCPSSEQVRSNEATMRNRSSRRAESGAMAANGCRCVCPSSSRLSRETSVT